jgi:glutamate racemase
MAIRKSVLLTRAGLVVFFFSLSFGHSPEKSQAVDLGPFFAKTDVTVAVVDSGLGGLSIMAEAAARLKEARVFKSVSFIFYNALFSNESGYNSLKSREEKIAVLNSALENLARRYRPDIILIGCNTLSVLYKETPSFKDGKILILDIVGPGVDLIAQVLMREPESSAILLGTETTIGEGEHKRRLMEQGVSEDRIITQACAQLADYIEKGHESEDAGLLIEAYVDEALAKLKDSKSRVYVGLVCTHYGYSLELWNKVFESRGVKSFAILNPNSKMANLLISQKFKNRYRATSIQAKVVSIVEINENKRTSLGEWLRSVSPETAAALGRYEWKPDLFEWKKYIKE